MKCQSNCLKKGRYNKTDIDWSYLSYSKIYLALGSEDIYYLPSAVGLGKIVDVLTPEGQIDFTIPLNICIIYALGSSGRQLFPSAYGLVK